MGSKSRKRNSSVVKTITTTANKALPVVDKGLETVGKTAKVVVETSIPVVEKGVSTLYNTMTTGLDLGIKGMKYATKSNSNKRSTKHRNGGRKTKRHIRKRRKL